MSNNPIIHYISTQYKPPTKTFRNANIRKSFRFRFSPATIYFEPSRTSAPQRKPFFSTKASVAYFLLIFANAKKV